MDDTLLFDYVTMVQMNQVESIYQKIKEVQNEILTGLDTYHNLEVVSAYYNKYGYTEHAKLLIGDEALFDNVSNALTACIAWLKKKLTQLVSYIFFWIRSLSEFFTVLVWAIVNAGRLNNTKSPYDIQEITNIFSDIHSKSQRSTLHLNYSYKSDRSTNMVLNELKEECDRWMKLLEEEVEKQKKETSYPREYFYKYAMQFQALIENEFRVELNTLADAMDRFQKSLNENDGPKELETKLNDMVKRIPIIKQHWRVSDFNPQSDEDVPAQLRDATRYLVQVCTIYSGFYTKVIRKGVSILKELHEAYNKGEITIHMEFPMDQDFLKRLSEYYGGPLKVTTVVFTNAAPTTWSVANEFKGLMGWCYPGRGSGVSFPTEFWINTRMLTSWWNRFTAAFANDGRVNIYDYFLSVMVHECKHLWDMQHGEHFDDLRRVSYKDQDHEKRARAAASKFEITARDRAWAKKIIDQVTAEIKKQKSAK